jgi:hypothetical protein
MLTQAVFRDASAWYHLFCFDTTQATAANRFKIYVNGVQGYAWDQRHRLNQNFDDLLSKDCPLTLASSGGSGTVFLLLISTATSPTFTSSTVKP